MAKHSATLNPNSKMPEYDYSKTFHPTTSSIIKWYQAPMGLDEKYNWGLLTMEEYAEWQKLHQADEENDAEKMAENIACDETAQEFSEDELHVGTFWKNDTESRQNLSSDDYSSFLSENNIDVTNRTAVDIDSLLQEN